MPKTISRHDLSHPRPPAGGPPPMHAPSNRAGNFVMSLRDHKHTRDTLESADRHFRRMRAALNASEGGLADRMFAGWRVRWRVHRLRFRLQELGVHNSELPPQRKAFVRKKVPVDITDVAWHEQLRLWWWPPRLSPDVDP